MTVVLHATLHTRYIASQSINQNHDHAMTSCSKVARMFDCMQVGTDVKLMSMVKAVNTEAPIWYAQVCIGSSY